MIARLLHFALRQRFLIILASAGLILLGIWSFLQLKIEAYPDISDTGVVIITLYPAMPLKKWSNRSRSRSNAS
jgi:heavy metal efflux system protein